MRWILIILGVVLGTGELLERVGAAELPPGGNPMLASPELKLYAGRTSERGGVAETVPVEGKSFRTAQRLMLPKHPANPWDAGARSVLVSGLQQGDRGILIFEARALPLEGQKPEQATAGGTAYLEEPLPPDYPKAAQLSFRCGPAWQVFQLPFEAALALPEGKGALVFHLAGRAQGMEMGPVQLLNFGKAVELKDLPRTRVTYTGREPDALWRRAAEERIRKLRMGPLRVKVMNAAGKPVAGAEVEVKQLRNAFGFGSAVTAQLLTIPSTDGEKYRAIVDQSFSRVVFENDLKMEAWEVSLRNEPGNSYRWEDTQKAMAWLKERKIQVRGHYLNWAPWEDWSRALRSEPDKIRKRIMDHIPKVAAAVGDGVMEWDAINHLAGWDRNIDEATGAGIYTEIMKACRAATPLPLWVNEDQVFRPGRQQEDYYARIQQLIADGQKPDGIGNQAHFDDSFLPSPEEILANSDRFAALVPALQITEFDVLTNGDEALEADYLRDVLTACYSHPAYTGFLIWGFWEGSHWKPEAALWRKDWSAKPSGQMWRKWVNDEWATRAKGTSNQEGIFEVSAHRGSYEIKVSHQGRTQTTHATVGASAGETVVTLNR